MPKRKPPAPPKLWARAVGRQWQIYLPTGETLESVEELDVAMAARMGRTLPTYWISFLSPVRDLTGDQPAIAAELHNVVWTGGDLTEATVYKNSVHLFASPSGTRAVVFEFHH